MAARDVKERLIQRDRLDDRCEHFEYLVKPPAHLAVTTVPARKHDGPGQRRRASTIGIADRTPTALAS